MGIYMQFQGIQGEATQQDHQNWIDVLSMSWGAGRSISTVSGSTANREASEPSLSELNIVKLFDAASPNLFIQACTGNVGKTVQIDLTTTGSPSVVFCSYTLSNCLISNYSVSSSGDRPTETIGLSFTQLQYKFVPYNAQNQPGTPTIVTYDMATTQQS